jgi:hypothetical protein
MTPIQRNRIETNFSYHPPHSDLPQRYEEIRARGKELALFLAEVTPESREQSVALTKLEEVVMWANAALARNTLPAIG